MCNYVYVLVYLIQVRGLLIKCTEKQNTFLWLMFLTYEQEIWELQETFGSILLNLPSNVINFFLYVYMNVCVHIHAEFNHFPPYQPSLICGHISIMFLQ